MPEPTPLYTVRVVDRSGNVYATLDNAVPQRITDELNGPGSASFIMGVLDPQALEVRLLTREVQIWRSGVLLFWGVPIRARANAATVEFQCSGLLWYFSRRYFGPVQRNWLANPSFEDGLTNWATTGASSSVTTTAPILGLQSARLVGAADADQYLSQTFEVTTDFAMAFTVAAWFRIDSAATFAPAFEERGLYVEATGGAEPIWEPITNSTERGSPQRLEVVTSVPAGTNTITVRLYAAGTIDWDATSATAFESVPDDVWLDAWNVMQQIIAYAQRGLGGLFGDGGKSELNIGVTGAVGIEVERNYQMADNGNILEALREFASSDTAEFHMTWNAAGTARDVHISLKRGQHRPSVILELAPQGRVADFSYDVDGSETETSVRFLGQGDGPDREIGKWVDTTATEGLVLEGVHSAPSDTPIDVLEELAYGRWRRTKEPVKVPTFTLKDDALIGVLGVGDTVPMNMSHGWVQDTTTRRIVEMTLDCRTDTLELRLNLDIE